MRVCGRQNALRNDHLPLGTQKRRKELKMQANRQDYLLDQAARLLLTSHRVRKLQHYGITSYLSQMFIVAFIVGPFLFGYLFSRNKQQKPDLATLQKQE